jgi:hypothetical protein
VGFQGAIVRVLLQCFHDLRRLIRAIICELSIAYSNPPRPRLLRTRKVFLACRHQTPLVKVPTPWGMGAWERSGPGSQLMERKNEPGVPCQR